VSFIITLPALIQLSASLREHKPARAIRFAMRSLWTASLRVKEGFNRDMMTRLEHKKKGKNSQKKTRCCFFSIVLPLR
jgi:ribosome maturation protein Sdo1